MVRAILAAAALMAGATAAGAQVKVGVVTSATGPLSVVGIQQKNTVDLLPRKVGPLDVTYIYLDDATDTTQTVRAIRKLVIDDGVDAIIGPSGSPNALAALPFVAESGTPLLAPAGSAAVVLPMDAQKRWAFKTTQNDNLVVDALVTQMIAAGTRTLAYIGTNDAYGESFDKAMAAAAEKAGIRVVASERFARTDTSVTGQALKILSLAPDAVLVGAAGAPTVLPDVTLVERGYKGRIYQTHGAATPEFLKLGGRKVEGTVLAASPMLVLDEVGDEVAAKAVALRYIAEYRTRFGVEPGTFGANVYDAGLLLERAIPVAAASGAPGTAAFRSALRDALEGTAGLVGAQGVYTMSPADHSGFDGRSIVPIVVRDGKWSLVR